MPFVILYNLMVILIAGLIAGMISKRFGIPMVIGYLLAGALIGEGGIPGILINVAQMPNYERVRRLTESVALESQVRIEQEERVSSENRPSAPTPPVPAVEPAKPTKLVESAKPAPSAESTDLAVSPEGSPEGGVVDDTAVEIIEGTAEEKLHEVIESEQFQTAMIDELAHLGALFLLFSIGIHFAPSALLKMKKFLFVGGPLQMLGVIVPVVAISYLWSGDWKIGFLIGCAASLSSTVLVFKSLEEYGQAASPFGLRAVAILLFQDMAIAPILLLMPLLFTAPGSVGAGEQIVSLLTKAFFFVAIIVGIRFLFTRSGIVVLQQLRSVELTVLFTVVLLFGVCLIARQLALPSALGAFAAGVALSETRLTHQISALTVPFRETFSAIFFVSLGALFNIRVLFSDPLPTLGLFAGMMVLKTAAGGVAFRILGLSKLPAVALGLGIAQLGELSFIVLQEGSFKTDHPLLYQQMLFVALLSIILTPLFLRIALYFIRKTGYAENYAPRHETILAPGEGKRTALIIGLGPIGRRMTSFLEISGVDVCLLDMNPVNLQPYAQEGFRTVSGDATENGTLKKALVDKVRLVVVTIPDDSLAPDVVAAVRRINRDCSIVARCRYTGTVAALKSAGADIIVCEESEAGNRLVSALEPLL